MKYKVFQVYGEKIENLAETDSLVLAKIYADTITIITNHVVAVKEIETDNYAYISHLPLLPINSMPWDRVKKDIDVVYTTKTSV